MKKIAVIFIVSIVMSCNTSDKFQIYLKCSDASGIINEMTEIKIQGLKIGIVTDIKLQNNGEIIIVADLNKDLNLPIDTDFIIENPTFIGEKIISVKIGKKENFIKTNDTVELQNEIYENLIELNDVEELINSVLGNDKRDSILIELKRLNKNLEELKAQ